MGEGKHCQGGFSFAEMARTVLYQTKGASQWGHITYDFHPMDVCKVPPCVFGGQVGDASIPAWVSPHERANFRSYFKYQRLQPSGVVTRGGETAYDLKRTSRFTLSRLEADMAGLTGPCNNASMRCR
eukprot:2722254-Rhodomonas_salina.1